MRVWGGVVWSDTEGEAALRETRRALLDSDFALDVVRAFTEKVREQAVGATVVKSVTPGQMVVKIVHDQLVDMLGSDGQTIDLGDARLTFLSIATGDEA